MSAIELINVSKAWGETYAVREVSFGVDEGSFVVLLGPSGCGKSTTLRMIAGLEDVTGGQILINGADMTLAPPGKRGLSMVFQSYALFPHLDTAENILFGLKVRKVPVAEQQARLQRVAEIVGLAELLERKPAQLSGGQRQRVALARAIIAENPICMMDEPLSNLDAKLRHEMRIEIRALQQRLGITTVYVTHDQTEAMSMADRVILMRDGRIEQQGTPAELYDRPATTFSASFIGTPPMNLLQLAPGADGLAIDGSSGPAVATGSQARLIMGIRPEKIAISRDSGMPAVAEAYDYLGADTIVNVRVGQQPLMVRVPGRMVLRPQEQVRLQWSAQDVHLFDGDTGKRSGAAQALAPAG
ncbi:MAG TPA: ABC transporter ATP-binding protein [Gammaproteobacteria bacterium]